MSGDLLAFICLHLFGGGPGRAWTLEDHRYVRPSARSDRRRAEVQALQRLHSEACARGVDAAPSVHLPTRLARQKKKPLQTANSERPTSSGFPTDDRTVHGLGPSSVTPTDYSFGGIKL